MIAALASGVPVVTTHGALTDRLLLESGGLLFAENSPEDITAAIESLRSDVALRQRIGNRAKRLYEENFHPKTIAGDLTRLVRVLTAVFLTHLQVSWLLGG